MKAASFWVAVFVMLGTFIFMTMVTNPQRSKYQRDPVEKEAPVSEQGSKTWAHIYAEFYDSDGLHKTMEVRSPKGYFNEADRDAFLESEKNRKSYGKSTRVLVIEDSVDLVFGIYTEGAQP